MKCDPVYIDKYYKYEINKDFYCNYLDKITNTNSIDKESTIVELSTEIPTENPIIITENVKTTVYDPYFLNLYIFDSISGKKKKNLNKNIIKFFFFFFFFFKFIIFFFFFFFFFYIFYIINF